VHEPSGHDDYARGTRNAEVEFLGDAKTEAIQDPVNVTPTGAPRAPVLYVVDDDQPTVELLCEVAREWGWQAVGFTRLAAVRSALDRHRPTLLIIDDDLPDGRGGDLARDLRRDPRTRELPLVVCTAATPRRQAEIGVWAPVVAKPFDLGVIEDVLAAAAARRNRVGESSTRRHAG
jgi:DNA-binding response OmpR family regulator